MFFQLSFRQWHPSQRKCLQRTKKCQVRRVTQIERRQRPEGGLGAAGNQLHLENNRHGGDEVGHQVQGITFRSRKLLVQKHFSPTALCWETPTSPNAVWHIVDAPRSLDVCSWIMERDQLLAPPAEHYPPNGSTQQAATIGLYHSIYRSQQTDLCIYECVIELNNYRMKPFNLIHCPSLL